MECWNRFQNLCHKLISSLCWNRFPWNWFNMSKVLLLIDFMRPICKIAVLNTQMESWSINQESEMKSIPPKSWINGWTRESEVETSVVCSRGASPAVNGRRRSISGEVRGRNRRKSEAQDRLLLVDGVSGGGRPEAEARVHNFRF